MRQRHSRSSEHWMVRTFMLILLRLFLRGRMLERRVRTHGGLSTRGVAGEGAARGRELVTFSPYPFRD